MQNISLEVPQNIFDELQRLATEHFRTIEKELTYKVSQGLKIQKHISDRDIGIFSMIANMYGKNISNKKKNRRR